MGTAKVPWIPNEPLEIHPENTSVVEGELKWMLFHERETGQVGRIHVMPVVVRNGVVLGIVAPHEFSDTCPCSPTINAKGTVTHKQPKPN